MNKQYMVLFLIVLALLIGGAALLSQSTNTQPVGNQQNFGNSGLVGTFGVPTVTETTGAISPSDAVVDISVNAKSFSFTPSEIRVKKGQTIRVNLVNIEGFHDFVIDELNVRTKQLQVGQSETISFTPDQTGIFEYYCSVGNHRQMGMVGKLIVE